MQSELDGQLRLENDAERDDESWFRWAVRVTGPADALDRLESVVYHLHPTFPHPVVEVRDRATGFELRASGWGEFRITAELKKKDGDVLMRDHWLELDEGAIDRPGSGSPAPSVYLTFSLADGGLASELAVALEKRGITVSTAESLSPYETVADGMRTTIAKSHAIVALISETPSLFIGAETEEAMRVGKPVIPVTLKGARLPAGLEGQQAVPCMGIAEVGALADTIAARAKDYAIPD